MPSYAKFEFSDEPETNSGISSVGAIVGLALGGALGIFLLLLSIFYFCKKKKSLQESKVEIRNSHSSSVAQVYPPYRISFHPPSNPPLLPIPISNTSLIIDEVSPLSWRSEMTYATQNIGSILESWRSYYHKTKQIFNEGLRRRTQLTSSPLILFQTLTQSNSPPPHPSAHLYALLFYASDIFFGHFLKSKMLSDDMMQVYTHFIYKYHASYIDTAYTLHLSSQVYSSISALLQTCHRDTFFQHWIHSDVLLCVQDICRLCWAYEAGVTVEQTRELVEEGIEFFFKLKAMEPSAIFFFPQINVLADPERMQWEGEAVLGRSKVIFTFWPGILDPDRGQVLEKARILCS